MGRRTLGAALLLNLLAGQAACGKGGTFNITIESVAPDAGKGPESDPRCATRATLLGAHPHASQQKTELGRTLSDTRGWKGRLYFAYGDLEANTGPIYITTFDPKTKSWEEHPVSYQESGTGTLKSTPAFYTHDIERFLPIGDSLWAPAAQPMFTAPFDPATAPEYAIATGGHDWKEVDIAPSSIHVVDAIERAPGDVYLTGSAFMSTDTSFGPMVNGRPGGYIWRSVGGAPFTQLFPNFELSTPSSEYFDRTGAWIYGGALNGVAYLDEGGFIYKHDGATWDSWEAFGEFLTPVAFAGRLVFADLGHLYAFDGKERSDLDFRFFASPGRYQGSKEPLALFQVTEGRLLAVRHGGDVMMTTDLETWTCIGKAPDDATSIGSLDGIVYFGSIDASVHGFPAPSW